MDFDDMAFAHMLKDYSVFSLVSRLSYAIRNWFVPMLLFNRVHGNVNIHKKCDRIITSVGWKQELCGSPVVTSLSARSKSCRYR